MRVLSRPTVPPAAQELAGARDVDLARWVLRGLWLLALGGAGLYALVYLALAALRVTYPFELHVTEGSLLDEVRRITQGQGLYAAPSLEYVPNIYPPLYFYLSAALVPLFGLSFTPLRVVSLLASLGCAALIFEIVRRETRHLPSAALAAGLFFAMFRVGGAWYDNARPDTLALCLSLLLVYLVRFHTSTQAMALAGVVAALALEAKQTSLWIVGAVGLYLLLAHRWRRLLWFAVPLGVTFGLASLLLQATSDGWYSYYVFRLPSRHVMTFTAFARFWPYDVLPQLAIAVVASTVVPLALLQDRRYRQLLFYGLVAASLVWSAWSGRAVVGGYMNALFPLCGLVAILAGMAFHRLLETAHAAGAQRGQPLEAYALVLVLLQFALLYYDPRLQFPRPVDRAAGERLVAMIHDISGEVFFPEHGYLVAMAGKPSSAHSGSSAELWGGYGGGDMPEGVALRDAIRQALAARRFGAVITEEPDDLAPWYKADLERTYHRVGPVFDDPNVFWPVTALRARPGSLWLPNP